jgi:hypothetical protein
MMARVQKISSVGYENNVVTVEEILHHPLWILKLFGVFIECHGEKFKLTRKTVGKLILNAISMISMVSNVTRMMIGFANHGRFSDKLMGRMIFAVLYISVTFTFPCFIVTNTRNLPAIQSEFLKFQKEFGFAADLRKMKRIIRAVVVVMVVISPFYILFIVLLAYFRIFDETGLLISRLLPFDYNDGYVFDLVSLGDTVITVMCILIIGSEEIIAIALLLVIIKEFQEVNRKICIAKEDDGISALKLQQLRHYHHEVTELLQTANSIIQHYVFFIYMMVIPGLCFAIYGIVYGNLGVHDIIYLVSILISYLLGMILLTGIGAKVNSEVGFRKSIQ